MPERLRLAVIGDPHLAVPRTHPDPRLEIDPGRKLHGLSVELLTTTIAEVNAEPAIDAALLLGDMTRDSELFNHEVAAEVLAQFRIPYYLVAGNHDNIRQRREEVTYPGEPRLDRDGFIDFYRGRGLPVDSTRYAVELPGGVVLIVLDSNMTLAELKLNKLGVAYQDHGWISRQQRLWLDSVLENVTGAGRLPLVSVHHSITAQSPAEHQGHPLLRFFRSWRLRGAASLRRALARHRVPLVLSGHLHAQSVNVEDGITNLVTAASVSYPHAWRLLTFSDDAIRIESRPLKAIPSCADLQVESRRWLAEGMGELIRQHSSRVPMLSKMSSGLRDFFIESDWWPRFCDGTQAGFHLDNSQLGEMNPLAGAVYRNMVNVLNEYGSWKAERGDPNTLEIPLA
jgi:Icc protein